MGLQTAVLHRVGQLSLRTTFVTGMIATACRELVNYLFWIWDHRQEGLGLLRRSTGQRSFINMALSGGIWLWYLVGAVAGGYTLPAFGLGCLAAPICLLIIAGITTAVRRTEILP